MEDTSSALEEENGNYKAKIKELNKRLEDTEKQCSSRVERYKKEADRVEDINDTLEEENAKYLTEIKQLKARLEELQRHGKLVYLLKQHLQFLIVPNFMRTTWRPLVRVPLVSVIHQVNFLEQWVLAS